MHIYLCSNKQAEQNSVASCICQTTHLVKYCRADVIFLENIYLAYMMMFCMDKILKGLNGI